MKKIVIWLIGLYRRHISPYKKGGSTCRFIPTCSEYAIEAVQTHGTGKGLYLALKRFLRCNPLNKNFGFDPVPPKKVKRKK